MEKQAQNIQEAFLNNTRKDKTFLTIYLMSGVNSTANLSLFFWKTIQTKAGSQQGWLAAHYGRLQKASRKGTWSSAQTAKINSIYYASDDPARPKSHNRGVDVEVGKDPAGDLLLIQGPLGLNWKQRKFGIFPRIENADVRRSAPPTPDRIDLWLKAHVHVKGRPEWCFVKIHTHGAQEGNMDTLLGKAVDEMHSYLEQNYNDGSRYVLHYVTAREMYNIVKAAEDGHAGNPNAYRDYILRPPAYSVAAVTESSPQTSDSKLDG
jgi:hypothetical protein